MAADAALALRGVRRGGYPERPRVARHNEPRDLIRPSPAAAPSIPRAGRVVEHLGSEDLIISPPERRAFMRCPTAKAPARDAEISPEVPAAHCHFLRPRARQK